MGLCLIKEEKYKEAINNLESAITSWPNDIPKNDNNLYECHYQLAWTYQKSNQIEQAINYYQVCLDKVNKDFEQSKLQHEPRSISSTDNLIAIARRAAIHQNLGEITQCCQ